MNRCDARFKMIALILLVISGVVAERCWFEDFDDNQLFWAGIAEDGDGRAKSVVGAIKRFAHSRTHPSRPLMMVQMERKSGSYIVALITKWQERPRVACYIGKASNSKLLSMREERKDCNRWINGKCGGRVLPDEFKEKWLNYLRDQPRY
ncbi:hypothetical protein Y032_0021g391 [Ancylostoma ceylanicum]|nr:hypothetical protein Y032_0021g391 [Ancylostoma ceylanicum]